MQVNLWTNPILPRLESSRL